MHLGYFFIKHMRNKPLVKTLSPKANNTQAKQRNEIATEMITVRGENATHR